MLRVYRLYWHRQYAGVLRVYGSTTTHSSWYVARLQVLLAQRRTAAMLILAARHCQGYRGHGLQKKVKQSVNTWEMASRILPQGMHVEALSTWLRNVFHDGPLLEAVYSMSSISTPAIIPA